MPRNYPGFPSGVWLRKCWRLGKDDSSKTNQKRVRVSMAMAMHDAVFSLTFRHELDDMRSVC